jgi:hypothetical protein
MLRASIVADATEYLVVASPRPSKAGLDSVGRYASKTVAKRLLSIRLIENLRRPQRVISTASIPAAHLLALLLKLFPLIGRENFL